MPAGPANANVRAHFAGRAPQLVAIYAAILQAAGTCGPVREEAKKTSIHLVRQTAFAGIAFRKAALILTVKSATDLSSPRIVKRERASANRWHLEIRLESPDQVDDELTGWLANAYALAGATKRSLSA